MNKHPDEILTIEEVAAYLKAGRRTVYRLDANRQVPSFKLGSTGRFWRSKYPRVGAEGHSKSDKESS